MTDLRYRATIQEETDELGHTSLVVEAFVEGIDLDRPRVMGWGLNLNRMDLALRLKRMGY